MELLLYYFIFWFGILLFAGQAVPPPPPQHYPLFLPALSGAQAMNQDNETTASRYFVQGLLLCAETAGCSVCLSKIPPVVRSASFFSQLYPSVLSLLLYIFLLRYWLFFLFGSCDCFEEAHMQSAHKRSSFAGENKRSTVRFHDMARGFRERCSHESLPQPLTVRHPPRAPPSVFTLPSSTGPENPLSTQRRGCTRGFLSVWFPCELAGLF